LKDAQAIERAHHTRQESLMRRLLAIAVTARQPMIVPSEVRHHEVGRPTGDLMREPLQTLIRRVADDAGVDDLESARLRRVQPRLQTLRVRLRPEVRARVAQRDDAKPAGWLGDGEFRADRPF